MNSHVLSLLAINTDLKIPQTSFKRQALNKSHNPTENGTLAIPSKFSGDFEELEERVKSMMEKSQNKIASGLKFAYICRFLKYFANSGSRCHFKGIIHALSRRFARKWLSQIDSGGWKGISTQFSANSTEPFARNTHVPPFLPGFQRP